MDSASKQGISVLLCNTDENPAKEAMYLDIMRDENVAGVILAPTLKTTDSFANMALLDIPLVVIDRRIRGVQVDSVLIDNYDSAYRIVEHLIADGHRRIAGLFGIDSTTGRERRDGYTHALKEHGLKPAPELVSYLEARVEDGYRATIQLLGLQEPPDAIFTSNGLLSLGAYKAIRESKLAVPGQIAFASFDETAWTPLVEPAITIIEQPTYEIGQMAGELLFKRLADRTRPTCEVTLKGKLIVRQSCEHHGQR